MLYNPKLLAYLFFVFLIVSCQKPDNKVINNAGADDSRKMSDLVVSESFNWSSVKDIFINIILPEDNQEDLLIITDTENNEVFFKGYRDNNSSVLNTLITIPTYISSLKVQYGNKDIYPSYIVDANNEINLDLSEFSSDRIICGCNNQVRLLSLFFRGASASSISVLEVETGNIIFSQTVAPGATFSFAGSGVDNLMSDNINLSINGSLHTTINTSCDVQIFVNEEFGLFTVVSGTTSGNISLCTTNPGTPTSLVYDGTLAIEDLWPSEGDYDFNDLVIDYNFEITKNSIEQIEKIDVSFTLHAMGAGFYNGFGFTFPSVLSNQIIRVSGYQLKDYSIINLASNGTESGQSQASIVVFDDCFDIMEHPGYGTGINTEQWAPYVQPETINIEIIFKENGQFAPGGPVTFQQLNIGHFNPFLIVNQQRGIEVHLSGFHPTDLADTYYLGQWDDDSKPFQNRYYVNEENYPWAINIPEIFDYPIERYDINTAYLYFKNWAESDGNLYPDWYKDYQGYRNTEYIYQ